MTASWDNSESLKLSCCSDLTSEKPCLLALATEEASVFPGLKLAYVSAPCSTKDGFIKDFDA